MKKKKEVKIFLSKKNQWKKFKYKDSEILFKGYIFGINRNRLKEELIKNLIVKKNWNFFKKNYGNFSIILKNNKSIFLISDNARSYPLYYYKLDENILISDFIENIKENVSGLEINKDIYSLSMMSGYSISNYTLYKDIYTVCAGQYIEITNKIRSKFYLKFFPNKFIEKNFDYYQKKYFKVLDEIFIDLKKKIKGEKIYLALSAGDDSRLIACMFKKHKFKNVICFSYGLKNNWEVNFSKKISNKLGFKHFNIIIESQKVDHFFKSKKFERYFKKYNNYDSVPSIHEVYVMHILKKQLKPKSIVVNGQPADGINGSYIYKEFMVKKNNLKNVFNKIIEKHYSLWPDLKIKKNIQLIKKYLIYEYKKYSIKKIHHPYQLMLFTSYQNRICKYLMKNFQVYENFNFRWYSPYMDLRFINFWFSIPLKFHLNRNLSKKILKETNLYNVWNYNIKKDNNFSIKTNLVRGFLKIFFVFNKKKWKKFDKINFQYFNDNQLKTHIVSNKKWRKTGSFRGAISFLVLKWLKNLDYNN